MHNLADGVISEAYNKWVFQNGILEVTWYKCKYILHLRGYSNYYMRSSRGNLRYIKIILSLSWNFSDSHKQNLLKLFTEMFALSYSTNESMNKSNTNQYIKQIFLFPTFIHTSHMLNQLITVEFFQFPEYIHWIPYMQTWYVVLKYSKTFRKTVGWVYTKQNSGREKI